MTPIETIEKEVPGMIGKNDATVLVIGELFEENIFTQAIEKSNARVNFVNAKSKHLIGSVYLKGMISKEQLNEAVNGYSDKINEILTCL